MRSTQSLYVTIGLALVTSVAGCSGNNASTVDTSSAGGDVSMGGNNSVGGTANLGGITSTGTTTSASAGGATGNGGTTSRGGGAGLGGGAGVGGTALGGSTSSNTGGANTGGTSGFTVKATGGSSSLGGSASTGGKTGTGGSAVNGTGGAATGGQNNATGGQGTGGLSRGPTSASSTANFPFPQNRQSSNCIYPTAYSNDDVQTVYNAWKSALVSNQGVGTNCTNCERVIRPAEPGTLQLNSTVSEGIGYGMIIAVYMNDQTLFDSLWRYEQAHTWTWQATYPATGSAATSLMNWYIAADGTVATTADGGQSGTGPATDADEDMAWALVMADRQWKGGQGSLSKTYLAYAQQMLSDIWKYEIDQTNLIPNNGNWGGINCLNISYFAPAYYRVFASVGNQSGWNTVVTNLYKVISQSLNATNGNQNNGLVPAFSTSTGAPDQCGANGASTKAHTYQYDSCRTPFRIGIDACFNDSTDAIGYVGKTSSFFSSQGGASKIVDGYQLNGTQNPQYPGGTYNGLSAAFIGTAGVGAMQTQSGQNYQSFLDDVYGLVRQNNLWCGGQYYDESWTMMSMLMMTGNFLDYTKY